MTRKERAAQHSPMYLYDFLQKLAPLRAAQIPAMESLRPNEVAYAWGDRKTAEKYTKDLPEKGEYFLLYAKKEALLTLYSRDVTPQAKYLDSLKTELLVPQEDGDSDLLEAALFEAAYLFDLLKTLEIPELFAPLGGFPELEAVYSQRIKESRDAGAGKFGEQPAELGNFCGTDKILFCQIYRESLLRIRPDTGG